MAIEKARMYSAPEGMDEIAEADGPSLEIEIIEPEAVILDDGSMEITLIPDAEMTDMMSFDINLAEVSGRITPTRDIRRVDWPD